MSINFFYKKKNIIGTKSFSSKVHCLSLLALNYKLIDHLNKGLVRKEKAAIAQANYQAQLKKLDNEKLGIKESEEIFQSSQFYLDEVISFSRELDIHNAATEFLKKEIENCLKNRPCDV